MSDEKVKYFGENFSDEELKRFRESRVYQYIIMSMRCRTVRLTLKLDNESLTREQVDMARGRSAELRDTINLLTYLVEDKPNEFNRHSANAARDAATAAVS